MQTGLHMGVRKHMQVALEQPTHVTSLLRPSHGRRLVANAATIQSDAQHLSPRQRKLQAKRRKTQEQRKERSSSPDLSNQTATVKIPAEPTHIKATSDTAKLPGTKALPSVNAEPDKHSRQTSSKANNLGRKKSRSLSPEANNLPTAPEQHSDIQAWPVFSSFQTKHNQSLEQYLSQLPAVQLAQLALNWADEIAGDLQAYAHRRSELQAVDGSNDTAARHVDISARLPRVWWDQLDSNQQTSALANVCALAQVTLSRLSDHATSYIHSKDSAIRSEAVDTASEASLSQAPHTLTNQVATQLEQLANQVVNQVADKQERKHGSEGSSNRQQTRTLQLDSQQGLHPLASARYQVDRSITNTMLHRQHPSNEASTDMIQAPTSSEMRLDRQHHADISWGVSHLICSRNPELCKLAMQLQHALDVPFFIMPMVLPGLQLQAFEKEVPLNRDSIQLGDKMIEESRLTGWQSDIGVTFKYSGKEMQSNPADGLTPCVAKVRDVLEELVGQHYDSVLINLYPDGRCGMRYHADPLYGAWTPETAVVSIGVPRKFVFRQTDNHSIRWSYTVRNGDCAVMHSDCQDRLQHSIITDAATESPRMSLVYKQRIPGK